MVILYRSGLVCVEEIQPQQTASEACGPDRADTRPGATRIPGDICGEPQLRVSIDTTGGTGKEER